MRTKSEVISFLESKVGIKVVCPGRPDLNGQCVTLIKSLMEYLGVKDPYKARGHAKTAISAYLTEGITDPGTGFLSVFSNKNMGNGYGHIWCNAGDGAGTYYESNGAKPLIVTKGKTYPYDNVCNFDKYIKEDNMADEKIYTEAEMTKVREERDKNWNLYKEEQKTIEALEKDLASADESIHELNSELETKDKQIAAYKGEVTKKETEIAKLQASLDSSTPFLQGKRKMLVALLTPVTITIAKIVMDKFGIEVDPQTILYLAMTGLAYIGFEGAKDFTQAVKGGEAS